MTDDEINQTIAEHLGWKYIFDYPSAGGLVGLSPELKHGNLPNYANDLNAMHEASLYAAEHLMDADQWEEYGRNLERSHPTALIGTNPARGCRDTDFHDFATLCATLTARQHAEAFLRTLNKWEEEV